MKIINNFSPNCNKKNRPNRPIKLVVIHYTGMQSERESLYRLCNPKSKVSSHFFINRMGKVYRLVKDKNIAWHAGKSCWQKYYNVNKNSIGIELVNKGHEFGYTNFTKKQMLSLIKVCKNLIKKYKIKNKNIVGHSDIAPFRKTDPGEKFSWKFLAKNKIGNWHNYDSKMLKKFRKKKILNNKDKVGFFKNLKKIGYCVFEKKKDRLNKITKAFQRHYRQELINGVLDKECQIIAEKLAKNS